MRFPGRSAFGVAWDDGTLKVALLARRGRQVRLQRSWRADCHRAADPARAALKALAQVFRQEPPGRETRVVVAAPDARAWCSSYLVPALEGSGLEDLVTYEVLRATGRPAEDVLVRYHLRKGLPDQQVHAFAPLRADVEGLRADLEGARLPFDDMGPPAFALASFVDLEQPWGGDRVLLGVGRLSTRLVVQTAAGLWARRLPLGLHPQPDTVLLAKRLKAELDALVAFFLPSDRPFEPRDIVLSEEGALDASLTGALKTVTGLPVRRFGTLERIRTPARMDWDEQTDGQVLCMGTAFGLALAGLGLGRFRCPVLGPNPRRESARRMPRVAVSLLLAAAGLVGATELAVAREQRLRRTLPPALGEELQRLGTLRNQYAEQRAGEARAEQALAAVARSRPQVFEARHALDVLSSVLEQRGALFHLEQLWLSPGRPDRPGRLNLTLLARPALDDAQRRRLREAFALEFPAVELRGPEAADREDLSRYVLEVPLP